MNLRQAAEMALEALEIWEKMQPNTSASALRVPAIQALRQALAQPEWVGLSDEEKENWKALGLVGVEIVAAHLKEKNS
jgi:hypothetical protein